MVSTTGKSTYLSDRQLESYQRIMELVRLFAAKTDCIISESDYEFYKDLLDRKVALTTLTSEDQARKASIAMRQESEHQGVQEAQMMQAMEFNSAWSQNMTEFERQARDMEEAGRERQRKERLQERQGSKRIKFGILEPS